jgi:hypothetical protein
MIWTIDTDDFLPECSNVRYPLLRAINSEFKANSNDKPGDKMRTAGSSVVSSLFCNAIIFQFTENNLIILHRNQQRASVEFYCAQKRIRPEFDLQSIVGISSYSMAQGESFLILNESLFPLLIKIIINLNGQIKIRVKNCTPAKSSVTKLRPF